jgi:hypothetical protein
MLTSFSSANRIMHMANVKLLACKHAVTYNITYAQTSETEHAYYVYMHVYSIRVMYYSKLPSKVIMALIYGSTFLHLLSMCAPSKQHDIVGIHVIACL